MLYIVVERYLSGPEPVYRRLAELGRMLPTGLVYVDSWVALPGRERCFQLMETDEPALFDEWISGWEDLVEFEVVAVVRSADARPREH